jgi:hypothetical protein
MAMLRAVKWVFGLLVLAVVGLFLHYVLLKHAVVYVTGVENRIVSPDEYTGIRAFGRDTAPNPQGGNVADVFFLNTTDRDGDSFVFRNEDTGFGFPFYFKFNSADVQADAQRAVSTSAEPRWQVVRYYGWRINFISMFPNALSVGDAAGPDCADHPVVQHRPADAARGRGLGGLVAGPALAATARGPGGGELDARDAGPAGMVRALGRASPLPVGDPHRLHLGRGVDERRSSGRLQSRARVSTQVRLRLPADWPR